MKRIGCMLTALVVVLSLSGCCFAPGYEGSSALEMRFMLPAKWNTSTGSAAVLDEPKNETREPISLSAEQLAAVAGQPAWKNNEFVNVLNYIPDLAVELKYATNDNITGKVIYDFDGVYLRYGTVVKLMQVQAELREKGVLLKIWDAFRPTAAQEALWEACPNPTFVANPAQGSSSHSRGNTVDVTLVDASGAELEMPTGFDVFTSLADRNYSDCTPQTAENAQLLEDVMVKYGFTGLQAEWWHFTDNTDYGVETVFDPGQVATWYANCNEYINLRVSADVNSEGIAKIPADDAFILLGWSGNFAYVEYQNLRGYVNKDYIKSSR